MTLFWVNSIIKWLVITQEFSQNGNEKLYVWQKLTISMILLLSLFLQCSHKNMKIWESLIYRLNWGAKWKLLVFLVAISLLTMIDWGCGHITCSNQWKHFAPYVEGHRDGWTNGCDSNLYIYIYDIYWLQ